MNQRIQQFLAAENISQSQFADTIDVARATVSHIISGRNKPGFDFIESISRHYPNLNIEWLITGKGKMYKSASMSDSNSSNSPAQNKSTAQSADNIFPNDDLFGGENLYGTGVNNGLSGQSNSSNNQPKVVVNETPGYINEAASVLMEEDDDDIPVSSEIAAADKAIKRSYEPQRMNSEPQQQTKQSRLQPEPARSAVIKMNSDRRISKIIVFYDDNTFQELT